MKLDNLKEEHLLEIIRLYELNCGFGRSFRKTMLQMPSEVLRDLKEYREQEYRIGSRLDTHSKIYFETDFEENLKVWFNPNFDSKDRKGKEYEECKKAGKEFEEIVMGYLG